MTKLVIIDGNAILHRAYHALPPNFKTPKGEPINAVYGLVSMLFRIIIDLSPTHLVFTFDHKDKTFRNELCEDYQSHRPDTDKDLISQFQKAYDVVSAFKIPSFRIAGVEADDSIGTIARSFDSAQNDTEIIIVTGDKDIFQLINDKVKVYLPVRGLSIAIMMGEKEVVEKMGVPPKLIIDYKALVGDPSDNYKGVPGIGPVTAIKLLEQYKNLDNIYNNLNNINKNIASKLKEHKKSAYLSQDLATIRTDVKLNFNLEKTKLHNLSNKKSLLKFEEFGFKTLVKRLEKIDKEIQSVKQISLI